MHPNKITMNYLMSKLGDSEINSNSPFKADKRSSKSSQPIS